MMQTSNAPIVKYRRWIPIAGLCLIHLILGCLHCTGNVSMYSFSLMRAAGNVAIRYKDAGVLITVMLISQSIVSSWIYEAEHVLGLQWSVCIGAYLTSLGVFLSFFTAHNFFGFTLTYGVLANVGYGLCFSTSIALAFKWCTQGSEPQIKTARVLGLLCAVRGIAVFICSPIQTLYLNPNNLVADFAPFDSLPLEKYFTDEGILGRVSYLFLYQGGILMIIQFIAFALISKELPAPEEDHTSLASYKFDEGQLTNSQILSNRKFWILWTIMLSHYVTSGFFQAYWKILSAQEIIFNDQYLSYLGAAIGVINVIGRLSFSAIEDQLGHGLYSVLLFSAYAFLLICAPFIHQRTVPYAFGWICCIAFLQGCVLTMFLCLSSTLFGAKVCQHIFERVKNEQKSVFVCRLLRIYTNAALLSLFGASVDVLQNIGTVFGLLYTSHAVAYITIAFLYGVFSDYLGTNGILTVLGLFSLLSAALSVQFWGEKATAQNYMETLKR